jgi:hypothetical protein
MTRMTSPYRGRHRRRKERALDREDRRRVDGRATERDGEHAGRSTAPDRRG